MFKRVIWNVNYFIQAKKYESTSYQFFNDQSITNCGLYLPVWIFERGHIQRQPKSGSHKYGYKLRGTISKSFWLKWCEAIGEVAQQFSLWIHLVYCLMNAKSSNSVQSPHLHPNARDYRVAKRKKMSCECYDCLAVFTSKCTWTEGLQNTHSVLITGHWVYHTPEN